MTQTHRNLRATSLSPNERFMIDQWAEQVASAFGYGFVKLVGSVARAEPWRDVDLRLILPVEAFSALTGDDALRLQAMNVAFSCWARTATGLPVDFQFQTVDQHYHDQPALPIGITERGDIYRHDQPA